jgi:hypothetical protein
MYCEIWVKHRAAITETGLARVVCGGQLGALVPLAAAYGRSAFYSLHPPTHSVCAFETVRGCFVIVRQVNADFSMYHIEGNSPSVPVQTLLEAVQDFAGQLSPNLRHALAGSDYAYSAVTVKLFADNDGRETGVEGNLTTLRSVLRERFAWSSLRSGVIAFVTSFLLIRLGLTHDLAKAVIYTFAIVVLFALLESMAGYLGGRGKIKWKLRER